jgi:hypothetical protein
MRSTRKITCDEATRLVSAGLDRDLAVPARATLRLHLLGCIACQRFADQMQLLRHALRGLTVGDGEEPPAPPAPAPTPVPPPTP